MSSEWTVLTAPLRVVDPASGRTLLEVTASDHGGARLVMPGPGGHQVAIETGSPDYCRILLTGGSHQERAQIDLGTGPGGAGVVLSQGAAHVDLGASFDDEKPKARLIVTTAEGRDGELVASEHGVELLMGSGTGGCAELSTFPGSVGLALSSGKGHMASMDAREDRAVIAVQGVQDETIRALAAVDGGKSGLLAVDPDPRDPRESGKAGRYRRLPGDE